MRCSADDPQTLIKDLQISFDVNVVGVVKTVNTFIPLLLKGREKKVFTLSTGVADIDLVNQVDIAVAAPYSISKAALNMAIAKYSALYKSEGILFMAISPGLVDTGDLVPSELSGRRLIGDGAVLTSRRSRQRGRYESISRYGRKICGLRTRLQGPDYVRGLCEPYAEAS